MYTVSSEETSEESSEESSDAPDNAKEEEKEEEEEEDEDEQIKSWAQVKNYYYCLELHQSIILFKISFFFF